MQRRVLPHTLLCVFVAPLVAAAPANYTPGGICSGVNLHAPARELLRGKHLQMYELEWSPFAIKDETAPHGWRGFDIDLITRVAVLLGFTFEIHEVVRLPNETRWTDTLVRTANEVDLWLSWWLRDEERMSQMAMLFGHVDASPTLVRPPPDASGSADFRATFLTFYRPFSPLLWVLILLMILLSGVVDYLVERGHGGTIRSSLYEYCGGVLWGGFQDPHTRISAVYQIANAFIIMIVVSAYTANLASTLTLARRPQATFDSLDGFIASRKAACTVSGYPLVGTASQIYTSLLFDLHETHSQIAELLLDGTCEAALVPRVDYYTWLTQSEYCDLETVEAAFYFSAAGWVTNLASEPCVQRPVEWALHSLTASGELTEVLNAWSPRAACPDEEEETSSGGGRSGRGAKGRRLQSADPAMGVDPDGVAAERLWAEARGAAARLAGGDTGRAPQPQRRRRLAAKGRGLQDPTADPGDADQLTAVDFMGIFILWSLATFLVLLVRALQVMAMHRSARAQNSNQLPALACAPADGTHRVNVKTPRGRSSGTLRPSVRGISSFGGLTLTPVLDGIFGHPEQFVDPTSFPPELDINSNTAMLRHLILEQARAHAEQLEELRAVSRQIEPGSDDAGQSSHRHGQVVKGVAKPEQRPGAQTDPVWLQSSCVKLMDANSLPLPPPRPPPP